MTSKVELKSFFEFLFLCLFVKEGFYIIIYSFFQGETRTVLHFQYTTWPDFGVPTSPDTFLQFLGKDEIFFDPELTALLSN